MKIFVFLLMLIPLSDLSAQDTSILYKHNIKVYPLNILGGHINVGYEHVLNDRRSIEINGSYYLFEWLMDMGEEQWFPLPILSNGFALRGSYRFYGKKYNAPIGLYFSPQVMYKYLKTKDIRRSFYDLSDSIRVTKNVFAIKFLVGHQSHILTSSILADVYAGIGFRHKRIYYDQFYKSRSNIEEEPAGRMRVHYSDTWVDYFIPSIHIGINFGIGIFK